MKVKDKRNIIELSTKTRWSVSRSRYHDEWLFLVDKYECAVGKIPKKIVLNILSGHFFVIEPTGGHGKPKTDSDDCIRSADWFGSLCRLIYK